MNSPAVAGRRTVVVAEDDAEIRDLEVFLLTAEGYQVIPAEDAEAALAAVHHTKVDLLLLDLVLPDRSGNEVLAELAHDPATEGIAVVIVSAFAKGLQPTPQVRRVLWKPVDITDLLDAVSHALDDKGRGAAAH